MKKWLGILLTGLLVFLSPLLAIGVMATPAFAATTANVTITATPSFISISVNDTTWDFGTVTAGTTVNTSTTTAFEVNNLCTVITNVSIAVNSTSWVGGTPWTHDDTATPGADTAGLLANKGGTWGTGDVIVKQADPNNIAANQAATTNFTFGLGLQVPTAFTDGTQKTIKVILTATAA
jgi:hypothetical protein